MKKTTVIENSSLLNLNRRKLWPLNLKCVSSLHFACFKKIRWFQSFFFETSRDHSLLTYLERLSVSVNMGNQYRQKTGFPLCISFFFFSTLLCLRLPFLLIIYLFIFIWSVKLFAFTIYRENERVKKRVSSKQNRPHFSWSPAREGDSPFQDFKFNYSYVLESKWKILFFRSNLK